MRKTLALFTILLILTPLAVPAKGVGESHDFTFTLLDGSKASLSDYGDRPILLDWSASWCFNCRENHKNFASIYPDYKEYVNFITISYYGSRDNLDDVRSSQSEGNYPWIFGLDTENYADTVEVSNAYVWILHANLTLMKEYPYSIVPTSSLIADLNTVLGFEVVSTDGAESSFDLSSNPLFTGFLVFLAISLVLVLVYRVVRTRTS